jgi:hypothetical protein
MKNWFWLSVFSAPLKCTKMAKGTANHIITTIFQQERFPHFADFLWINMDVLGRTILQNAYYSTQKWIQSQKYPTRAKHHDLVSFLMEFGKTAPKLDKPSQCYSITWYHLAHYFYRHKLVTHDFDKDCDISNSSGIGVTVIDWNRKIQHPTQRGTHNILLENCVVPPVICSVCLFVCLCVCACVCMCMRVCMRVWAFHECRSCALVSKCWSWHKPEVHTLLIKSGDENIFEVTKRKT